MLPIGSIRLESVAVVGGLAADHGYAGGAQPAKPSCADCWDDRNVMRTDRCIMIEGQWYCASLQQSLQLLPLTALTARVPARYGDSGPRSYRGTVDQRFL